MKNFILGAILLLAAACAAPAATGARSAGSANPSDKKVANADPNTTYVCEKVRPTGSNIPEEVCRTVRQRDEDRRQAQEALSRPRTYPVKGN